MGLTNPVYPPLHGGISAGWVPARPIPEAEIVDEPSLRLTDWRFWLFVPVFAAAAILRTIDFGTFLAFGLVALYALFGPRQCVVAFLMNWFLAIANPGIFAESENIAFLRYAVLPAGFASLALHSFQGGAVSLTVQRFGWVIAAVAATICLHSLAFSEFPDMSFIKALYWGLSTWIIIACFARMDLPNWRLTGDQLFALMTMTVLLALPLLATEVGYLHNGRGFQGLTNHSMAFGSVAALLALMCFGRIFAGRKPLLVVGTVLFLTLICAFASQSRTGIMAMLISLLACGPYFLIRWLARPRDRMEVDKASRRASAILVSALFLILATAYVFSADPGRATALNQSLQQKVQEFVTKSGRDNVSNILDAYENTRGEVIFRMKLNIEAEPWTGIGFGVPSELRPETIARDPVFGFIVAMPVEKGAGPYAIIEELGVILAMLVFGLWALMIRMSMRAGVEGVLLMAGILLLNLAEFTFFAPGGMGMAPLVLGAWACCRPISRSAAAAASPQVAMNARPTPTLV